MSQIRVQAVFDNHHPVTVVLGWDRPLQHCFLNIPLEKEHEGDESFAPLVEAAVQTAVTPMEPDEIAHVLEQARIAVPATALAELESHMRSNLGNIVIAYDAKGEREVLLA
jgi:hypothetical protein